METTATMEAAAVTTTSSGLGRARREHGDRCGSEQDDHRFA
jgi:hypothetical protein